MGNKRYGKVAFFTSNIFAVHIVLLTGVLGYEAKNIIFSVFTESEIQTPFFASIYKILMVI